ncbi:MAG: DUF58 domain-containing protein [Phycisphaeraceae bacterium]|nr:DUF58 domain-containing protein [Phycisphaeraceae bacterium]
MSRPRQTRSRRRYHLRGPGLAYIGLSLLIALGAFNSQNNLLFWAFSFTLALLIVSGLLSGGMLMGIAITREAPSRAVAGHPISIAYALSNRNRLLPAFAIEIVDTALPPAPADTRSIIAFAPSIGARADATARALLRPMIRGRWRLVSVRLESGFPFGIFRKSIEFPLTSEILVRPAPIAPDPAILAHLDDLRRLGERTRDRPGSDGEFFALREYVSGDSPRLLAWRASARRGELLVRQPGTVARAGVLVDLDLPSAGLPADAEHAISRAAGLIIESARRGMEVGLVVRSYGIARPCRLTEAHAARLLDDLAQIDLANPALPYPTPFRIRPQPSLPSGVHRLVISAAAPAPATPA